ncbi:MAG: 3-deoxy-D-manno-octulosonic acid transferase, partial [Pyrinomonadaceae bacterium]
VYPLAEFVFVGGSIARHGGHNILEPAAAARCILTGPHTFNFEAIVRAFREQKALVQLPESAQAETPAALADLLRELLGDEERRAHMGQRARAALDASRGATERTIRLLAPLLESRGVGSEEQTF